MYTYPKSTYINTKKQIQACDKFANQKEEGEDEVIVNMTKPQVRRADVTDNEDGSYSVYCPFIEHGKYSVDIFVNGETMRPHADVQVSGTRTQIKQPIRFLTIVEYSLAAAQKIDDVDREFLLAALPSSS